MLSSISGAGGFEKIQQLLGQSGGRGPGGPGRLGGGPPAHIKQAIQEKISGALEQQGLDEETQELLKADIEAAVTEFQEAGSDERSDLKETIDGILEQYGVDREALSDTLGESRPKRGGFGGGFGGGGFGGGPFGGGSFSSYASTEAEATNPTEQLLEALLALDEEA